MDRSVGWTERAGVAIPDDPSPAEWDRMSGSMDVGVPVVEMDRMEIPEC